MVDATAQAPLTIQQSAERLGVSYETMRRIVERGETTTVRVGCRKRIRQSDLDAYCSPAETVTVAQARANRSRIDSEVSAGLARHRLK
jgi:excisionase family DNA binding protein